MRNRLQLIALIILVFTLTGCGSADVKVWSMSPAEATSQASSQEAGSINSLNGQETSQTYTNDIYGFTFNYPTTWTVNETSNRVSVEKDGIVLNINFKRATEEDVHILPSGMAAGDVIKGNPAEIYFLGEYATKSLIQLDGVTQTVTYGNGAQQIDQMEFFVQADINDFQVATNGITPELESEMDDMVRSLDLVWAAFPVSGEMLEDWNTYTHDDYGFSFRYPPTWELEIIPGETSSVNFIGLTNGTYRLTLAFKAVEEEIQIMPSGIAAGEFQKGEPMLALINHQAVDRIHLVHEDRIKSVIYADGEFAGPLEFDNLQMVIMLDDTAQVAYEDIELSQDIRDEADTIITSLHIEVDEISEQ